MTAGETDRAAEPLHARKRDVEADTTACEEIGALFARGEAGEEEKLEERLIVGGLGQDLGHDAGLDRTRAHRRDIDPGAVVGDADR